MTTITIKSALSSSMQGLSKSELAHAVAELAFNDAMLKRITSAKVFVSATTISVSYEIGPKPEAAPEPAPAPKRTRTRKPKTIPESKPASDVPW